MLGGLILLLLISLLWVPGPLLLLISLLWVATSVLLLIPGVLPLVLTRVAAVLLVHACSCEWQGASRS